MTKTDLDQFLERIPRPVIQLHLSGGMIFEITARDDVVTTDTTLEMLMTGDATHSREVIVNLFQIVWMEVITPPV